MNWQDEQKKVATGVTGGQEPVAQCMVHGECFGGKCIYTHAQPKREWVGLLDEEIDKTYETQVWDARRSYARAIEAKLKEKNT